MSSDGVWAKMRDAESAMHTMSVQRQALQSQLAEAEHALGALPQEGTAYRIVGQIMVRRDVKELRAELTERQASLRARVETATHKEKELRQSLEAMQRQVVQGE